MAQRKAPDWDEGTRRAVAAMRLYDAARGALEACLDADGFFELGVSRNALADLCTRVAIMPAQIRETTLELETTSESNDHRTMFRGRYRRAREQRSTVVFVLRSRFGPSPLAPPVRIVVTRHAPRRLDPQNLGAALKAVIDGVADYLGIDDGDARLLFALRQQPTPRGQYVHLRLEWGFGAVAGTECARVDSGSVEP